MTFFQEMKKSYKDVQVDAQDGISTTEFLEATESLTKLFDALGSTAFAPVKSDLNGNVTKIRDAHLAAPGQTATLSALISHESALPAKKRTATEALVWLRRGLDFTAKALRRSQSNPTEELSASFTNAYENTLRPHHNMFIRPIFALAMKACPYRKDFYEKIGGDAETREAWLSALERQVEIIKKQLEAGGNTA